MTLNDLQGHSLIATLFKMRFLCSHVAVDNISTIASRGLSAITELLDSFICAELEHCCITCHNVQSTGNIDQFPEHSNIMAPPSYGCQRRSTLKRRSYGRPLSVCLHLCLVMLVYCGQTVGRIKMPLGTEVGFGPGHIVLDGDPAPSASASRRRKDTRSLMAPDYLVTQAAASPSFSTSRSSAPCSIANLQHV